MKYNIYNRFNKKKSISSLVATIILVVVAVVLVGILLNWDQGFLQDSSIDTSCNGAHVNILSCDYNSLSNNLKFTMINDGNVKFDADQNFDLLLIDSENDVSNFYNNILESKSFNLGESKTIEIENYTVNPPINVQLRNTQCKEDYWELRKCNLYSWSSQDVKDTTENLSETSNKWMDCGDIDLVIESGCTYDTETGIDFMIHDLSDVNIDDNIEITVIDSNNTIVNASVVPKFTAGYMAINNTVYSNTDDFTGLQEPILKVEVNVASCPKKSYYITNCN